MNNQKPFRGWGRALRFLVVFALLFAPFAACSLNPQPIPPGAQPDGSAGGANPTFAADAAAADAAKTANDVDASDANLPPAKEDGGDAGPDGADAHDD